MAASRTVRAAALAAAALAVGAASTTPGGREADARAFALANRDRGPGVDGLFKAVTELGSIYASAGGTVALLLAGRRRAATRGIAAACGMWTLGQVLKRLVVRPRPYEADLEGVRRLIARPRGASWPSSHPAVFAAFTQTAARELGLPRAHRVALGGLAGVVAASRVALGVHYPSDVVSGLLLGRAVALLASPDPDGRPHGGGALDR